jgi:hypothetical protein
MTLTVANANAGADGVNGHSGQDNAAGENDSRSFGAMIFNVTVRRTFCDVTVPVATIHNRNGELVTTGEQKDLLRP